MPVIPGTIEEMKELLLDLEELDIFGINLLEFCFPLENAKAFPGKGFRSKKSTIRCLIITIGMQEG